MHTLTKADHRRIVDIAVRNALTRRATREILSDGIDPFLWTAIHDGRSEREQIELDITTLSDAEADDRPHPLAVWLDNAASLLGDRPDADTLRTLATLLRGDDRDARVGTPTGGHAAARRPTLPPPLPRPHLPRPAWISRLAARTGVIIGPSGAGKTTAATELLDHLRSNGSGGVVLYVPARADTTWRGVLGRVADALELLGEGMGAAIRASLSTQPYLIERVADMADACERCPVHVALVVDLVDGAASPPFRRTLTAFARRLDPRGALRIWIFGQIDPLDALSPAERAARGFERMSAIGLDRAGFLALAELHGVDRVGLDRVYDALTGGRRAGVPLRTADAVLRLGTAERALAAARSDDEVLAADTARYAQLGPTERKALGALACLTHGFSAEEAEQALPHIVVRPAIRAGLSIGLLHSLSAGRFEFHETVRRNVLTQQTAAERRSNHTRLADGYAAQGDQVLEAHHAERAGLAERARAAGREAFFDPETTDRVSARVIERGWVSAAEALDWLRANPRRIPFGCWNVLEAGLDDATADALLAWWRASFAAPAGDPAANVVWSAGRALVIARPDRLPEVLEAVASAPVVDGLCVAASAVGHALRAHDDDPVALVERFDQASGDARRALADALRAVGGPRCLARWLAYVASTGSPPRNWPHRVISEAHVDAIVEAMPEVEPSTLLRRRNWGFGAATSFFWAHRRAVGDRAAELLDEEALETHRAGVALRLLGATGHPGLLRAAEQCARRSDDVCGYALMALSMVDRPEARDTLARLAVDPDLEESSRATALMLHIQSGDDPEHLLTRLDRDAPNVARLGRDLAGFAFVVRPTRSALTLLVDTVLTGDSRLVALLGPSLLRADEFADGPHADAVARQLLPLLELSDDRLLMGVLTALTRLRRPVACGPCARLAVRKAGDAIGGLAAVAACASRPRSLDSVREAVLANPEVDWLLSALAARFGAADARPHLIARASDQSRSWAERRRALLSLSRFERGPDVDAVLEEILAERPLLARHDSAHGQFTETVVALMTDQPQDFARLWAMGEAEFVDVISQGIHAQKAMYSRATTGQLRACATVLWRAVQAADDRNMTAGMIITEMLDAIHLAQVQAAALRAAAAGANVELLERVLATSDAPWLVIEALLARARVDPRTRSDARRWVDLISTGPCGGDEGLAGVVQHIAGRVGSTIPPRALDRSHAPRAPMTFAALRAVVDGEAELPPHAQVPEMTEAELDALVDLIDAPRPAALAPPAQDGADQVTLTADGALLRPSRPNSAAKWVDLAPLRAYLAAWFPERSPGRWLGVRLPDQRFLSCLVDTLADAGDPVCARAVLVALPADAADLLFEQAPIYRLGSIADDALVGWFAAVASGGGVAQVMRVAAFASTATTGAVVPLLALLMRRMNVAARAAKRVDPGNDTDGMARRHQDPWTRALIDIISARRLADVPGAGAWLSTAREAIADPWLRARVVDAMAALPSTWAVVEAEALKAAEYTPRFGPDARRLEDLAHRQFHLDECADAAAPDDY